MTCVTEIVAMSTPPHLVRGVLTLTLDELAGALLLAALIMPLLNFAGLARCLVAARAISTARTHVGPLADERQLKGQVVVSGALGQLSHCYRLPFLGCFLLITKVYHTVETVSSYAENRNVPQGINHTKYPGGHSLFVNYSVVAVSTTA